jgi:hypothetical protein
LCTLLSLIFHDGIELWQVPLSVLVGWILGVPMDLDFHLLETGSLFPAILVTTFTLQVRILFALHRHYTL